MPARKCRGNSSYRHLAPVRLSLMSRRHSTAAPSPSRYGKRYEVEGRTNFRELRKGEVRRIHLPRTSLNKGIRKGRGCYAPTLRLKVAPTFLGTSLYPCPQGSLGGFPCSPSSDSSSPPGMLGCQQTPLC